MKKTILYLCFTSLLTISNAIATEVASRANDLSTNLYPLVELLQTFRAQNISLWEKIEAQELKQAMGESLGDREREDLKRDLAIMTQEKSKEQASKEAQQNLVRVITEEQLEANQLFNEVLEQLIPQEAPPIRHTALPFPLDKPTEETAKGVAKVETAKKETISREIPALILSTYQQKLLLHRNLIGDNAWAALNGTNPSLSAKLCEAIQRHSGKTVEIYCLKSKNFTLWLNGRAQDKIYKF